MDPSTGRFISQDKYLGTIEEPITLHKYLYANSNPVNYIDPSGYSSGTLIDQEATMDIQGNLNGISLVKYNIRALYSRLNSSLVGKNIKEVSINIIESSFDGELTGEEVAGAFVESVFTSGVSKHLRYKCFNTNSALISNGTKWGGKADETVDLFRAIGPDEYDDIMTQGIFRPSPRGYSGKQFGRDFDEVLKISDHLKDIAAIVKVNVLKNIMNIFDLTPVDRIILRKGSVTVQPEMLDILNRFKVGLIEHVY